MRNLFAGLAGAAIFCLTPAARAEYVGDYNVGDTICGYFNTYRPSTGASFTLASGALEATKDNSATQDTDGLTLDNDFDSVTGRHQVCVNTAADGTFYSAGSRFSVYLSAGTVDSVSVIGAETMSFSLLDGTLATLDTNIDDIETDTGTTLQGELDGIETDVDAILVDTSTTLDDYLDTEIFDIRRAIGPATTTIATLASQVSFTLTAGSANDNAYNGYGLIVIDASTPTQSALACVLDYTGSTRTVTLAADPAIFSMTTTDNVILLPAFCNDLTNIEATLASVSSAVTDIDTKVGTPSVLDSGAATLSGMLEDTFAEAGAVQPMVDDLETNLASLQLDVDAVLVDTSTTLQGELDVIQAATDDLTTGVPIASYTNAAGDVCLFVISEAEPHITVDCTEAP
jgi:hypothetical protein